METNKGIIGIGLLVAIVLGIVVIGGANIAEALTTTALSDTFTGGTIDTAKWTPVIQTTGNVVQSGGSVLINGQGGFGVNGLRSVATFDRTYGDVTFDVDITSSSCTTANTFAVGYGDISVVGNPGESYYVAGDGSGKLSINYFSNGSYQSSVSGNFICTNNISFHLKLVAVQTGGMRVYVNGSGTPELSLTGASSGTFTNKGVYVQHINSSSNSTYDNATVSVITSTAAASTSLSGTVGAGQVSLAWTAPTNTGGNAITDYLVEYRTNPSGSWNTFDDGVSATTGATVISLSNGTAYDFRVSAINAAGTGTTSALYTATPSTTAAAPVASNASISGYSAVGQTLTGSYTYFDNNGNPESGSTYRWLSSDTVGGSYLPISDATTLTYTIVSADIGKYLKFEVTPINATIPTTGTVVASSPIGPITAIMQYFNHILSTGQSLSVGSFGTPPLSIAQPYDNKGLSGSSLVALVETAVESPASAMANGITSLQSDYQIVATKNGVGGYNYGQLKKGTAPYATGLAQVQSVKDAAYALHRPDRVSAVTVIHGESDHVAGTTASEYLGYLSEWQSDYENDIKGITGQSGTIPLFTDQMDSYTTYGQATSPIPLAQLAATENNPNKLYLVTPKYFLTYSDGIHLLNTSYRWLGEYYAKVMKKVIVDGEVWKPLSPTTISRNGNILTVDFHVPSGSLVFDTTVVSPRTNYGFDYSDSTSSASITNVEIFDSHTVKITLNQTPTGANPTLSYAYTGTAGALAGAQSVGSAAGNLRDSDTTISASGNTLYDWAVQFSKIVGVDTVSPILSSGTPTGVLATGTTSTTLSLTTNEDATCRYSDTANGTYTSMLHTFSTTGGTNHSTDITNLSDSTAYVYYIRCSDTSSNQNTDDYEISFSIGGHSSKTISSIGSLPSLIHSIHLEQVPSTTSSSDSSSAYNFGSSILRIGSQGYAVKELQRFLNFTFNAQLVVDGKLGPKTIIIIKQWQLVHDLVPDGIIGPKTMAKIKGR